MVFGGIDVSGVVLVYVQNGLEMVGVVVLVGGVVMVSVVDIVVVVIMKCLEDMGGGFWDNLLY